MDEELRRLLRGAAATARRLGLPGRPILYAGDLAARVCLLGRDLGADEVRHGQPLVGHAGRVVRAGVLSAAGVTAPPGDALLERALDFVLLANLVPFHPPGNKPWPARVREAFRPFLARLLVSCWTGDTVITLGNQAFHWFDRYAGEGAGAALWAREDRFACTLRCRVEAGDAARELTVCPLPHPSPANARWKARFPALLAARLAAG